MDELTARKEAEENGINYERLKALDTQVDMADRTDKAKRRKTKPDMGFSSFEDMSMRQYERLVNGLKPDLESYQKMKSVVGEKEFYPDANTLIQGSHYPTNKAMDKLSADIKNQYVLNFFFTICFC